MPLYNPQRADLQLSCPLKLTGTYKSPVHTDYDVFGLHKKRTLVKGELQLVEYFKVYDGVTYSDLVISETRTYTRNFYNLVEYRTQVSTWYCEDDSIGIENTIVKYYTLVEAISESNTRRNNLIDDVKIYILSQVGMLNCYTLLSQMQPLVDLYIQGNIAPLIATVSASLEFFMTAQLKLDIIDILTIPQPL